MKQKDCELPTERNHETLKTGQKCGLSRTVDNYGGVEPVKEIPYQLPRSCIVDVGLPSCCWHDGLEVEASEAYFWRDRHNFARRRVHRLNSCESLVRVTFLFSSTWRYQIITGVRGGMCWAIRGFALYLQLGRAFFLSPTITKPLSFLLQYLQVFGKATLAFLVSTLRSN